MCLLKQRRNYRFRGLKGELDKPQGALFKEPRRVFLHVPEVPVRDNNTRVYDRTTRKPLGGKVKTPLKDKMRLSKSFEVFHKDKAEMEEGEFMEGRSRILHFKRYFKLF